jgi:hypothetical protein
MHPEAVFIFCSNMKLNFLTMQIVVVNEHYTTQLYFYGSKTDTLLSNLFL